MYRYPDTSTTDFHCSATSICSMESTDTLGSCFRAINNRKSERRRVSFAQDIERVQIVENFRLTLSTTEKESFWPTQKQNEDEFLEETLISFFGGPVEQRPRSDTKRRRPKSRRPQQTSIFGDISTRSPKQKSRSTQKSTEKSERKSPLQTLRSRLGLRRRNAKKSIAAAPLH